MQAKASDIPQCIRSALFKEQERFFLLHLEKDLGAYIRQIVPATKSPKTLDSFIIEAGSLKNSYYRLLAHHLCEYYNLRHDNNSSNEIVVSPIEDEDYSAILNDLISPRPARIIGLAAFTQRNKKLISKAGGSRGGDNSNGNGTPKGAGNQTKSKVMMKKRQKSPEVKGEKSVSPKNGKRKSVIRKGESIHSKVTRSSSSEIGRDATKTADSQKMHYEEIEEQYPSSKHRRHTESTESRPNELPCDVEPQQTTPGPEYPDGSEVVVDNLETDDHASPTDQVHDLKNPEETELLSSSTEGSMDGIDLSGPSPPTFFEAPNYVPYPYFEASSVPMPMSMTMPYNPASMSPHILPPQGGFYQPTHPQFMPQMVPYPMNFYSPGFAPPQQPYPNYSYPYNKEIERKILNNPYIILPDSNLAKKNRKPTRYFRPHQSSPTARPNNTR